MNLSRPLTILMLLAIALSIPAAPPPLRIPQGYIVGADISSVQAAEDRGVKYSDNGTPADFLQILKNHGFNYIRLRTFVDPTKPTPRDRPYSMQGYCDLPHTITMGKRVKSAGMGLLIDFHYSDSWADPQKQYTPSAWTNLAFPDLVKQLHDYTRDSVAQMKTAGARPDMVQIGNEITPGLMVDRGGSVTNWPQLAALLKAGAAAVKEADPAILVMLHIDRGGDNPASVKWIDAALAQGVSFDILGESCYTRWQGQPAGWRTNFFDLAARYPNLSFLIAEVGFETKDANDIMRDLPDHRGLGTFIWEPAMNNTQQALFDRTGAVLANKMAPYDELWKQLSTTPGASP